MATSWKSQQCVGKYALQFETDDKEKYKFVEKESQMAVDGKHTADVVEVVRCKDCKHWRKTKTDPIILIDYGECCCKNFWDIHLTTSKDFCSYGERKEG